VRLDWVHPHRGIVDLKTTADLTWFENECKRRRYHNQLAFYQAVLAQVIGQLVPVYLIGIEKVEPFRCGVWQLSDNTLAIARQENEAAIRRLRRAWEIDAFPTGYEEIRILDVTYPFSRARAGRRAAMAWMPLTDEAAGLPTPARAHS
jgi:hypothetical protein